MAKQKYAPRAVKHENFLHYIPWSPEDERMGMWCTTAGTTEVGPGEPYPPKQNEHPAQFRPVTDSRILKEFQIIYITKGRGIFEAEGATHKVKAGTILLVLPDVRHRYLPDADSGWQEHWAGFQGGYFQHLLKEGFLSTTHLVFDVGLHSALIDAFRVIMKEIYEQKPLFQLKACSLILTVLAEMLSSARRKEQPDLYQQIVEKVKYIMEENVLGAVNIPLIAQDIGLSSSRLTEVFKRYTAMTPYQYYISVKINRAKDLLEDRSLSIQTISAMLGFEDQYYFSRLFKSKAGLPPSRWRKYIEQN